MPRSSLPCLARGRWTGQAGATANKVPTYNDVLVKLAAVTLCNHRALQSQWQPSGLVTPTAVHIAVAVDTPAGLLAPVIRDADGLSLRRLAVETSRLADRALAGQLTPEEMKGGTFTVTNLGAHGIDVFTPIINLPQCAILGIGRIRPEAVVCDSQVVARHTLPLSLTFDHRAIDGATAARFLDALRLSVEQPGPALID